MGKRERMNTGDSFFQDAFIFTHLFSLTVHLEDYLSFLFFLPFFR